MSDILSLWRSPLDKVALTQAEALSRRQPRCSCEIEFNTDFDLMTVYNFGSYLGSPSGDPITALTNMFDDMAAATPIGGMAFIPQESYAINLSNALVL